MSDKLDDHRQHASPPPEEEFISYAAMINALALQFPLVPLARIETIALEEHEIITGGVPHLVPSLVHIGTLERLEQWN